MCRQQNFFQHEHKKIHVFIIGLAAGWVFDWHIRFSVPAASCQRKLLAGIHLLICCLCLNEHVKSLCALEIWRPRIACPPYELLLWVFLLVTFAMSLCVCMFGKLAFTPVVNYVFAVPKGKRCYVSSNLCQACAAPFFLCIFWMKLTAQARCTLQSRMTSFMSWICSPSLCVH